jgi:DNA/RNA-binding domain of Phe-tRNA-synthetase-like protein
VPVAVFDLDRVAGSLEVRFAVGDERYETFSGDVERPDAGEVVFRDDDGWAHARRWSNRQSGRSAIRQGTSRALLVAEAMHVGAADDMPRLLDALREGIARAWGVDGRVAVLSPEAPAFDM